ncbi:hypothetical protein G7046_g3099 [Stylonectria norvegica]|nr:hypothetical protein G7046_g3099 [Stylonectria norvegica]
MAEAVEKDRTSLEPAPAKESGPITTTSSHSQPPEKAPITETQQVPPKTGADAALELLKETGSLDQPFDAERNRKLLWKIDLHIMPLICIVYFLQYIDKTAISYASVTGIIQSTGLKGNDFNWVASIFFFGQLAFEFPTIRLVQLFPLAKYVSVNVTLWGIILASMAACKSYSGLLVCRFFLGVLEAAIVPAWVLFTSMFYTKEEQAFRVGIWFSVCGAAQMFGGYFAYGVATHVGNDPSAALKGWQIILLILGLITALVGIAFWFIMPNSPADAGFLNKEEKRLHLERIRQNEQGIGTQVFKWNQVWEALRDPMTWLYAFWIFAANIPNSIATSFGNILVKGMGYTGHESLLLVTPLGAWEIVALLGLTYGAMKTRQRLWFCVAGHIPAIIGAILMATTEKVPALVGYYTSGGIPIGWTTILGLQSSNVAGSTKKITVACIGTIAYTVGNIISPHTFQAGDAPRYLPAKISICIIYFLCTIDLFVIRWVFARRNKQRDQEKAAQGENHKVVDNHEFFDLTDLENREFSYSDSSLWEQELSNNADRTAASLFSTLHQPQLQSSLRPSLSFFEPICTPSSLSLGIAMDLSGLNDAELRLVIQCQREDLRELLSSRKGKEREDDILDANAAIDLYKSELAVLESLLSDRRMCVSIADAVVLDGKIIDAAMLAEDRTARDRQLALKFQSIPVAAQPPTKNDEAGLDDDLLTKLAALYVGCPEDGEPGQPESSGWATRRCHPKTSTCISCHEQFAFFDVANCPCSHDYCRECLKALFNASLKDQTLFPPKCCTQPIPLDRVHIFLSAETIGSFKAKKLEFETPNPIYCHIPTCSTFVPLQLIKADIAKCVRCNKTTCCICKGPSHKGDCPQDEAVQQLERLAVENQWQRCSRCSRIIELDLSLRSPVLLSVRPGVEDLPLHSVVTIYAASQSNRHRRCIILSGITNVATNVGKRLKARTDAKDATIDFPITYTSVNDVISRLAVDADTIVLSEICVVA